jgi:hypothetical protein
VSEWLDYLEAYEAYLEALEADLARGGPGLGRFDARKINKKKNKERSIKKEKKYKKNN